MPSIRIDRPYLVLLIAATLVGCGPINWTHQLEFGSRREFHGVRSVCIDEAYDSIAGRDLSPALRTAVGVPEDCATIASLAHISFKMEVPCVDCGARGTMSAAWAQVTITRESLKVARVMLITVPDRPTAELVSTLGRTIRKLLDP